MLPFSIILHSLPPDYRLTFLNLHVTFKLLISALRLTHLKNGILKSRENTESAFLHPVPLFFSFSLHFLFLICYTGLYLTADLIQHLSSSHCRTVFVSHMAASHVSRAPVCYIHTAAEEMERCTGREAAQTIITNTRIRLKIIFSGYKECIHTTGRG